MSRIESSDVEGVHAANGEILPLKFPLGKLLTGGISTTLDAGTAKPGSAAGTKVLPLDLNSFDTGSFHHTNVTRSFPGYGICRRLTLIWILSIDFGKRQAHPRLEYHPSSEKRTAQWLVRHVQLAACSLQFASRLSSNEALQQKTGLEPNRNRRASSSQQRLSRSSEVSDERKYGKLSHQRKSTSRPFFRPCCNTIPAPSAQGSVTPAAPLALDPGPLSTAAQHVGNIRKERHPGRRAHQAGNQDDLPLAVLVKAAHQSMDGESDKVYVYIQEIFREVLAIALSSEDDTGRTATRQVPRRKSAPLAQQSQMHMR
ncbi:hypothetical protein C8035_v001405 [Colletotrichum spinosum]|uniref:Uncharacterized protein n=1 Tax=Colletotrichum spinosum TaxID=1347390 RepID=A0A4R8Q135_9PEZI|nr:hypothetical protein C8035_v001405 [Colletotrichum spinosum]